VKVKTDLATYTEIQEAPYLYVPEDYGTVFFSF